MLNLFAVMILPPLMAGIAALSIIALIIWLISSSFPGRVIPADDEDEIVGDGSTLRRQS